MKTLRKIFTVIMILTFCVSAMAGCKAASVSEGSAGMPGSASADNDPDTSKKIIKQEPIQSDGNVIRKELAFVYNGSIFAISDIADDEKLEGILGKAAEKKSHTYSSDDGLNMDTLVGLTENQYKFTGLDIKTINSKDSKEFNIFNIKITDPNYPTSRNIKVGDSLEKLKGAYPEGGLLGNGEAGEDDDFQYLPVNYADGMKFHIKDKKIESILIYKLLD